MEDRPRRVTVLTGAGISAESGIATFRGSGGMWNDVPIEEVATPQGFARDPEKVWRFYAARREQAASCSPNVGHRALARLEEALGEHFTLVTQNVDGLHEVAGNRNILEIHGSLWRFRCTLCGIERKDRSVPLPELPPRCDCGGMLRPSVVWFGEAMPEVVFSKAVEASQEAALFLIVGTSAQVEPAAGLARLAASRGADLWEINPEETPLTQFCRRSWRAPAGEVMGEVVDSALSAVE